MPKDRTVTIHFTADTSELDAAIERVQAQLQQALASHRKAQATTERAGDQSRHQSPEQEEAEAKREARLALLTAIRACATGSETGCIEPAAADQLASAYLTLI